MQWSSRSPGVSRGLARNIWSATYLPASVAANIRGTSIAKTVISPSGDCVDWLEACDDTFEGASGATGVGPRDAVERTS